MKKRLIFLLPLLLLACRTLFPDQSVAPAATAPPAVATSPLEATVFAPKSDYTMVRIYPKNGTLQSQLAAEAAKASALGQAPFVEFDATWCPPCKAITTSLAAKDPLMLNAYRDVYLIHVDTDEWGWGDPAAGFVVEGIPAFFALNADGTPTGATTSGAAWQEDIPKNIAPVLTKFFHP